MAEVNSEIRSRAVGLFRYLKELTELRIKTIRTLDNYEEVVWFDNIPREDGCHCYLWSGDDDSPTTGNLLRIEKPRLYPPPSLPEELIPWLDPKQIADSSIDFPELQKEIRVKEDTDLEFEDEVKRYITVSIDNHPEINKKWEQFVEVLWWPWAEKDRVARAVQEIYTALFSIYQKQQRLGEMFEVVLGMGLLTWRTPNSQIVFRHLITAQVNLHLDSIRGIIAVDIGSDGAKLTLEQDMLEATERPPVLEQQTIETELVKIGDNVWEKDKLESTLKSWIHSVSANGVYVDNSSPPLERNIKSEPQIYFSPALILRKRNERNLIQVFREIITQLQNGGEIPIGVRRLVEIVDDYSSEDSNAGSDAFEDIYFPLEFNPEQEEIISRLASRQGVLVQGPPGTGKSHTIANLVCHLLANGKRVLVTSQAPRALTVLSRMIPQEVASLCVSLLGYDRAAMQDLEDCVLGITDKYNFWDSAENQVAIKKLEESLDSARKREAELLAELRALREQETYKYTFIGEYKGTLASIAKRLRENEDSYSWIGILDNISGDTPPLPQTKSLNCLKYSGI